MDGRGWYDANTPVRSIQKGYLLSAERDLYEACSVSVDGADWGGAWHAHVLAPAPAALWYPTRPLAGIGLHAPHHRPDGREAFEDSLRGARYLRRIA